DKGKGILIELVKPMKRKDQIMHDEEVALKLQAAFDEEERLTREKAKKVKEANIALIETWDDIQAKIDADHQLAKRMQAQEQEEMSIAEKATLFQQLLEKKEIILHFIPALFSLPSTNFVLKSSNDKGKGVLIELVKPMKRKDQIMHDEEVALKFQAAFDEEERLTKEKAKKVKEANIALIETWDDIQAKIDADHQLAERMQAQEQEEMSIAEKATLFQKLLEKKRNHFAVKRA
nr:hypothetical protein [Tanacetum cinerariifolium]